MTRHRELGLTDGEYELIEEVARVRGRIDPMARLGSRRLEQPEAVVVLKRPHGNAGQGRELAHSISHGRSPPGG